MFNAIVLDRFQNPRNAGIITSADGVGQVGNVRSGEVMKLYLRVEKGSITNAKFKAFGGVAAIAAMDAICDLLKGKTVDSALKIGNNDVINALHDIPEDKIYCVDLAQAAIIDAVNNYYKKSEKDAKKKK